LNKKPAVFLDRDGVLTVEKGYICPICEIEIFPYVKECIKEIHRKNYFAIVITNQSGVARGVFTEEQLLIVNENLIKETEVDAVYYCPHFVYGKVARYSIRCNCRKPDIGLIENACNDFDIDMSQSYMVGDQESDIITGINAGIKTVLLESVYKTELLNKKTSADYVLKDLRELIGII